MKRDLRWVRMVWTILAVCGVASLAGAQQEAAVDDGRALYQRHCELCHGSGGRGDGPIAKDLIVPPADLTGIAARRAGTFPDAEMREIIDGRRRVRGHGNEMPAWGEVFTERTADPAERRAAAHKRIADLIAYLRSIQVPPTAK